MGDEAPMDEAKSAALQKLQAVMRGKVMRAELAQANFLRILMGSAAERLQAAFRGRQVRKMDKEELVKTATEKRAEFKKQQSMKVRKELDEAEKLREGREIPVGADDGVDARGAQEPRRAHPRQGRPHVTPSTAAPRRDQAGKDIDRVGGALPEGDERQRTRDLFIYFGAFRPS